MNFYKGEQKPKKLTNSANKGDINQVWAVILPFLQKYGKAKRTDLDKIIGDHLSEKQLRRYIDILKEQGLLKTEGQTNQTVYLLGETYQSKNDVINKALSIGLQKMKEDGEI